MQGQQRPCQDSICSMLACLWPWATALGNGSVLWTSSLLTGWVLKAHSSVRNETTYFLGAEKLSFVLLSGDSAHQHVAAEMGQPTAVLWCHQARQSGLSTPAALAMWLSEHTCAPLSRTAPARGQGALIPHLLSLSNSWGDLSRLISDHQ